MYSTKIHFKSKADVDTHDLTNADVQKKEQSIYTPQHCSRKISVWNCCSKQDNNFYMNSWHKSVKRLWQCTEISPDALRINFRKQPKKCSGCIKEIYNINDPVNRSRQEMSRVSFLITTRLDTSQAWPWCDLGHDEVNNRSVKLVSNPRRCRDGLTWVWPWTSLWGGTAKGQTDMYEGIFIFFRHGITRRPRRPWSPLPRVLALVPLQLFPIDYKILQ